MDILIQMKKQSLKNYEKDLEKNLGEFYDACEDNDEEKMLKVAKKGAGIKMMIDYLKKDLKEAENSNY